MPALNDSVWFRNRKAVLKMVAYGETLSAIQRVFGSGRRHLRAFLRRQGIDKKFPAYRYGDRSGNWRGGRLVTSKGYVRVYSPGHPDGHGRRKQYVWEHRLVMEKALGRRLLSSEVVHHENGDRSDNRIENLVLFPSNGQHLRHELTGKVPKWTPSGLDRLQEAHGHWSRKRLARSLAAQGRDAVP